MLSLVIIALVIITSNLFVKLLANTAQGILPKQAIMLLLSLSLPQAIATLLPICFFLAIIITYGRMFSDNEMTIMLGSGISWLKLVKITLPSALILALLSGTLSLYLVPTMTNYQHSLQSNNGKKENISLIQTGIFMAFNDGKNIVYVERKNKDKVYKNVFIYSFGKPGSQPTIVTAPSAYVTSIDNKGHNLILKDGYQYTGKYNQPDFRVIHFNTYTSKLSTNTTQISNNITSEGSDSLLTNPTSQAITELQWRLTYPIATIVLMLLAFAICKAAPNQGRYAKIIPSILILVIYFNLITGIHAQMQADNSIKWYWNLITLHLAFAIIGLFALYKFDNYNWFKKKKVGC